MAENKSLVVFNDNKIGDTFCSFKPDTMEGKMRLYNAINNPDKRLADFINKEIMLKDVVVKVVQLNDNRKDVAEMSKPDNWEMVDSDAVVTRDGFRVILIDANDVSYSATSTGIYNSISTLRSVFGTLHFDEPIKIEVNQVKTKNGNTLTLKIKM